MADAKRALNAGQTAALTLLKQAYDEAERNGRVSRENPVGLTQLKLAGVTAHDLGSLVRWRLIERLERIDGGARTAGAPKLDGESGFVLSYAGKDRLESEMERTGYSGKVVARGKRDVQGEPTPKAAGAPKNRARGDTTPRDPRAEGVQLDAAETPEWRALEGELWFRGELVWRRGRKAARLEELVLDAFKAKNWARAIPTPLANDPLVAAEQLRGAIRRLNDTLLVASLQFHARKNGEIACWEPRE
jgi:hypothetical protein